MKRPEISTADRKRIIDLLDLPTISQKMEDEAIEIYQQGQTADNFVSVGKFVLMPEALLKCDDEIIIGACLGFLNENFCECQVSVFRKQRSQRQRVAFAKCAMVSIMVVVEM